MLGFGHCLCARHKSKVAYCAVVAEVEVTHQVNVRRSWVVADIGEIIHEDGAVSQLEGGAIQSTSWALKEQGHWDAYPTFRFSEVPKLPLPPEILSKAALA